MWRILEYIPNKYLEPAGAKIELLDLNNTIYKISSEATYQTSKDMPEELKKALPDIDELKELISGDDDNSSNR